MRKRRPWTEELDIVDRTMKAISSVSDPEELVDVYWNGIGQLIPTFGYVALSRRNEQPPFYVVTRSSRFTEHLNPWTQRDRLPVLSGGILGEIIYANKPLIINDLPARLSGDDPGYFFLEGFQQLIALPNYDEGEGINATAMLLVAFYPVSYVIGGIENRLVYVPGSGLNGRFEDLVVVFDGMTTPALLERHHGAK